MRKKFLATILAGVILLTACGADTEVISQLNGISALNAESTVSNKYNLSYADEQEMIYAQVADRRLLDLSALEACSDNEIQQVINYMNMVDNQLCGKIDVLQYSDSTAKFMIEGILEDNAVIDSTMTDYLLAFMQQTPYQWQRTKTTVRGIDSESRSIIVDVQYKTIDFEKDVMKDSTIVRGDPFYDRLIQSRYNKWMMILGMRVNNPNSPELPKLERDFLEYFGDAEEIIEEQNELQPTADIYQTGIQKTYSGLISSNYERDHGTINVRYILVPNYVLGINLGVTCLHMYILDYSLNTDFTEDFTIFTQEGYQTVADSVYNLVYSYFTCLDESDFEGLYKQTSDFQGLDKHYEDVFNSTYQKHNGFSVSLFDITGTHITCGVTISTKERPKCSNMTFPVYTDRYYMELELVDDTLKVNELILLSRRLEGEPAINEDAIDTTGFTATIDLDNDDKVAIEKLICDFSAVQLNGDTTSDNFSDVVDMSISMNQLESLKGSMMNLTGVRKVVFLQNYQQGTSNYASVRCKELYQSADNSIVESIAVYEFIMKGGRWYVYNYDVNSSVKLDTTNLTTTGSLCLVTPGKVEAYTSQIKSTSATNLDEVSDISVAFDHNPYIPVRKEGIVEQGKVLIKGSDIDGSYFMNVGNIASFTTSVMEEYMDMLNRLNDYTEGTASAGIGDEIKELILEGMAIYLNLVDKRYPDVLQQQEIISNAKSQFSSMLGKVQALEVRDNEDMKNIIRYLQNDLSNLSGILERA